MTELRTPRLTLRDVTTGDAAFILELLNEPGWLANIGDRNVHSLDDARAYIEARFAGTFWLVARDSTGAPVGLCGLVDREGLDHLDVGYAVLERYSGQGYASEMVHAVLAHAQQVLGHETLLAITTETNVASQRVLLKTGFQYVGVVELPGHGRPSALFST